MDNTGKELVEQLRKMNEQSMKELLRDSRQKRSKAKFKQNLKENQARALEELKKQYTPTADSTNSSLNKILGKLFD
ncbi:hypothetical protein NLX67_09770 [Domibacillus sp. A3M-37]|uniref:hypothetical protein n=1 Tax=Domibacillus TaxID=1433999 RepID=UPI0020B67F6B|nr:hypothetical protein [Domibacillus sp. A3M-37]MCP3762676.1 hypothetical protein [Domibacillus sp. A3M-37]